MVLPIKGEGWWVAGRTAGSAAVPGAVGAGEMREEALSASQGCCSSRGSLVLGLIGLPSSTPRQDQWHCADSRVLRVRQQ